MSYWKQFENKIIWDFRVGDEFKKYTDAYAFVIDVYDEIPRLALYKIKKYSSESSPTKKQPPEEMLVSAVEKQGGDVKRGGLFNIDEDLRYWIRNYLFQE